MLEAVPWFLPAVYWMLALTGLWLLASLPAVALRRFSSGVRDALKNAFSKSLRLFRTSQADREGALAERKQRLVDTLAEQPFDTAVHEQWMADALALSLPVAQSKDVFAEAARENSRALPELTAIKTAIAKLSPESLRLADVPVPTDAIVVEQTRSVAWLNLGLALLLLAPIVVVNAQLTALVLGEALPDIRGVFVGLPPAYVLALIITLAEAGVGVAHGEVSARQEEAGRQYSVGLVIVSVLALFVILLETLFYSQFRQSGDQPFALPIFGIEIQPGMAFGLVGLILGSSVFMLGRLAYSSARSLVRHRSLKSILTRYESLRDAVVELGEAAESRKQALTDVSRSVSAFHEQLTQQSLLLDIRQFDAALRQFLKPEPAWVTPTRRELSDAEILRCDVSAIAAMIITTVAVSLAAVVGAWAHDLIAPGGSPLPGGVLGLIAGLCFGYAGFVLEGRLPVHEVTWRAHSKSPAWSLLLLGTGALAVGLTAGAVSSLREVTVVLAAVVVVVSMLMAGGAQLARYAPFAWLAWANLVVKLRWLPAFVVICALAIFWMAGWIVDAFVGLLAFPAELVITVFRPGANAL